MGGARETSYLLESPAGSGALQLATKALRDARAEAPRLDDAADWEAVHDFRVAIRRLRTILRTYSSSLGIDDAIQRRLRELAAKTNDIRDAEAHVEWLERAQVEIELSEEQRESLPRLLVEVRSAATRPPDLTAAARLALSDAATAVHASAPDTNVTLEGVQTTFGEATSTVVRAAAGRLGRRLSRIQRLEDVRAIHKARLAGKRLRYVLEPLALDVPEIEAVLLRLRELQDILGELHDLSGLAARVDREAPVLRSLIETRMAELFDRVTSEWVRGNGELFSDIEGIQEALVGQRA